MPKGIKQTSEEFIAELQHYAAMGGSFTTIAGETVQMCADLQEVRAQLKTMSDAVRRNMKRMVKAAKALINVAKE